MDNLRMSFTRYESGNIDVFWQNGEVNFLVCAYFEATDTLIQGGEAWRIPVPVLNRGLAIVRTLNLLDEVRV